MWKEIEAIYVTEEKDEEGKPVKDELGVPIRKEERFPVLLDLDRVISVGNKLPTKSTVVYNEEGTVVRYVCETPPYSELKDKLEEWRRICTENGGSNL